MIELIQGSDEWLQARCGSVGASRIDDLCAKIKTGYGASRANLMAELLVERLTGKPTESYVNAAMQHGIETELEARAAYEMAHETWVKEVGLIRHPRIAGAHASPDGLVGDNGLVEIKCPNTATHIDTLLRREVPSKYVKQMQWQMVCADRAWCDFVSYDPRMPPRMQLFVQRVRFDPVLVADLETEVAVFISELDAKIAELRRAYGD